MLLKTQAATEIAQFLAHHPTPEQIVAFHPSPVNDPERVAYRLGLIEIGHYPSRYQHERDPRKALLRSGSHGICVVMRGEGKPTLVNYSGVSAAWASSVVFAR